MSELKPCPMCGCEKIKISEILLEPASLGLKTHKVCCFNCSAQIYRGDEKEAITAWNRRAGDDA